MTTNLNAIAAIIEAHEPNTVGCTECDWTPGSSDSFSEHVARIIDTMGEQPTCKTLSDGSKVWFLNGELHRTDGPAVETPDGYKAWYVDGKRHRTDGPAFEAPDGGKEWYVDGVPHRTDGPAIEWASGAKEWYVDGERLTAPTGSGVSASTATGWPG